MTSLATLVLLLPLAAPEAPLAAGRQWTYQGTLEARDRDAAGPGSRKTFELRLWIARTDAEQTDLYWLLDERGRGQWPWTDRVGHMTIDAEGRATGAVPALLYDRGEGRSVVSLPAPLVRAGAPLAAGVSWQRDKFEFSVERTTRRADRSTWQVAVRDAFGPRRTLWIDQGSPLLIGARERVIMGRGEEYELQLDLAGSEQLAAEAARRMTAAAAGLLALRTRLGQPPRVQDVVWKPAQVDILRAQLPAAKELAAGTPLEKLAVAAERDLDLQAGRNTAVADLGQRFVGQAAPQFSIRGASGESLSTADLPGRVTVLHFWEYRDEPLKEPYGQVGYLDFLYQRRQGPQVQVFGVAVDGRLADEAARGAAIRGVKKLKAFMNLSYPILLDAGELIRQFGDPRVVGAALPLVVVIDADGKVAHYHVGHYDVQQDRGLGELERVVAAALEKAAK